MFLILAWIAGSFLCAFVASQKGRSASGWWFLSMLLSPLIALIALCAIPSLEKPKASKPQAPSKFAKLPPAYLTSL